jgi:hypothetical protein
VFDYHANNLEKIARDDRFDELYVDLYNYDGFHGIYTIEKSKDFGLIYLSESQKNKLFHENGTYLVYLSNQSGSNGYGLDHVVMQYAQFYNQKVYSTERLYYNNHTVKEDLVLIHNGQIVASLYLDKISIYDRIISLRDWELIYQYFTRDLLSEKMNLDKF